MQDREALIIFQQRKEIIWESKWKLLSHLGLCQIRLREPSNVDMHLGVSQVLLCLLGDERHGGERPLQTH